MNAEQLMQQDTISRQKIVDQTDSNFFVEAGAGSGKTTILSLICRNYDIQKGQILIDGIDIKRIKISSLRRHFGQMLQDVFLFAGDIRSNILGNWHYILGAARPFFSKKVLIAGTESCGKTTLTKCLANLYNTSWS